MEKDSLYKFLYRFFDLIVLTYFVFSFGYSVKTDYQIPKLVGLLVIVLGLLAFNTAKFFYYKSRGRKKVALAQIILMSFQLAIAIDCTKRFKTDNFHPSEIRKLCLSIIKTKSHHPQQTKGV